jgi:hypothetical protein
LKGSSETEFCPLKMKYSNAGLKITSIFRCQSILQATYREFEKLFVQFDENFEYAAKIPPFFLK